MMPTHFLSKLLLLLLFFTTAARGDQLLDGVLCNDHGWPIRNARGDVIQYGVEILTSGSGVTVTALGSSVEKEGWTGVAKSVTKIKKAVSRQPDFWLPDGPGPRYPGVFNWFHYDAVLYARDQQQPTGSTLATFDYSSKSHTVAKNEAELLANLTKYATTFHALKAACGSTPLYKYVGRCNTPDLKALIDKDPAAAAARLREVYDFWEAAGVDVMIVDAASSVGGHTRIGSGDPYQTDRTGVIDQFLETQGRLWREDPSRMAIAIEAWPFSSTGRDPQSTNATTGPRGGERWGFPTAVLINGQANNGAYKANGEVWDELYAPADEHLWLMLCPHTTGKWAMTASEESAALVRDAALHNVSAVAIVDSEYVAISALLPPQAVPRDPWSPARR